MDTLTRSAGIPLLVFIPLFVTGLALIAYLRYERSRNRRNPLTQALLNAPGTSLRNRINKEMATLESYFLAASVLGGYCAGYAGSSLKTGPDGIIWSSLAALSLIALGFLLPHSLLIVSRIRRMRLGLDGEMAAGEELNQLMQDGYQVFHDIPGADYNVDHVVVGQNGVFAVETKTHPKSETEHEAIFDGHVIHYPDCRDFRAIDQARRNARTLGQYLSKAVGRPVPVHPVVVLPGWFVKQKSKSRRCTVLASGQIRNCFPLMVFHELSKADISAVCLQLEHLCRGDKPLSLTAADRVKYERKLAI